MNKKKYITIPIVLIITILYVAKVYCLNKDYPQKDYIESVNMNEEILCQDFDIRVVDARIESIDPSGFPIAVISYDIKNASNKKVDLSNIYDKLSLYSNYDKGDIQNINLGFDNSQFDTTYDKNELVLNPKEEKIFKFNYYLLKDYQRYNNFIYINNSLYAKEFNNHLEDGVIFYKTINLEEIYE